MSVDIDSLIIGCHIRVNGKRAKVISVESTGIVGCRADDDWLKVTSDDIEPIPLTHELLDELGFEEDKTDIAKRVGGYYIYFHQINNLRWRVSLEEENCTNYGNCIVRYLHEAESFLGLHNVELIKE